MVESANPGVPAPLPPWLQTQLEHLLTQRGHALLLCGPSGLGQFELALALARAWLCEEPSPQGACGQCGSCHAVAVHTHADLCVLLPETLSLAWGWPLDEKVQDELDSKKRKPSKDIKVEAARQVVNFSQSTRARSDTKVVLVFPAERMNGISANTLLKTLEEPPGALKFILATEAAHQLLPTIRSRCLSHSLAWPEPAQAQHWLASQLNGSGQADLLTLLQAAGGRPADALALAQNGSASQAAAQWQALPQALAQGDVRALADYPPAQALAALQKLCHDLLAIRVGATPRFFRPQDLPAARAGADASPASLRPLTRWSQDLLAQARTVEHPYNPGLLLEAWVSQAQTLLRKVI